METRKQYSSVIFLQDSESESAMQILEDDGEDGLFEFLWQWDNGDIYNTYNEDNPPWGTSDTVKKFKDYDEDKYILVYNKPLGYCGLYKVFTYDEDGNILEYM
jgi:predicted nucleic-acid-binding Zn-ribbon protein